MSMKVSRFNARTLCALLTALPALVHATTMIQRGPVDAPNDVQTRSGSGYLSWNLDEVPFVSDGGVKLTTKVAADDGTGVIRVYAESDTRGVSGIPDTHIALARGQVSASAVLAGTGTAPVPVSFRFGFDGSFLTHAGNSFHQLGAGIVVTLPSFITHQVSMDFSSYLLDDNAINVAGKSEVSYLDANFTYITEPYAGGSYGALSTSMEEVAGFVQLDMMMLPGQRFEIAAHLLAQSYSEPLIPTDGPLDYSQSWGAVDGFNTGTLAIMLPEGFTLTGNAAMLTNAVAPVPEPQVYALFAAGLAAVLAMTRRRRWS